MEAKVFPARVAFGPGPVSISKQYRPVRDMHIPFEDGGILCGKCGCILPHDSRYGSYQGNVFVIGSYNCPRCHNLWATGGLSGKDAEYALRRLKRFEWRRLMASHGGGNKTGGNSY